MADSQTATSAPEFKSAHFIGIGGAGMSGIALVLHERGYTVTGSDLKTSRYIRQLTRAGVKVLTSLGDVPGLGKDVFQVEMGAWKRGDVDGYEVTIPGTSGSARGTFVDMGNPHVVAVLEDAFASLPNVEDLDLVTKPVVAPEIPSDQNVEFVRIDEQSEGDDAGEATMRVNERGCGETLSCGTGLCATAITLRAKTGIDHWTITVRGGTLRVDVTDEDVKLTGSATIVGKIELL